MFKRISTRNRAMILSVFLTALYFVFYSQSYLVDYVDTLIFGEFFFPVFASIIMFIGIHWVLHFHIKGERYITVAAFASVSVFIVFLFFEFLILNQTRLGKITTSFSSMLIIFVLNYVVLLTMNILNYSYLNQIPLGQAGRAASYVLSLIIEYLAFFLLFSNDLFILVRFGLVFIISLFFTYSSLWTLRIAFYKRIISSLSIASVVSIFAIVLNIWPISTYILCLVLSLILYISLGIALEVKEKVGKYIWLEYGVLLLMIFLIISLLSDWGINGQIF